MICSISRSTAFGCEDEEYKLFIETDIVGDITADTFGQWSFIPKTIELGVKVCDDKNVSQMLSHFLRGLNAACVAIGGGH